MSLDISLELYRIFCVVVNTGNMSAAARQLFISQPAVSMAIKQLEDKLGKPLLIRSSRGIKPTAEGQVMYEYLNQALGLIEAAENKYMEMVNLESGEIRIGASDTILSQFLMPYIKSYIEMHGNINIRITNRTTYETLKLLKNGCADIGFVNLPLEHDDSFEVYECLSICDCLIGGSKYEHLSRTGVELRELSGYPLMLLERESNSRRHMDKFAEANGVVLRPAIELGSSDLLVKFASINLGLSVVIREFTLDELNSGIVHEIPLRPSLPARAIGLVKLRGVVLSHAAQNFAGLLKICFDAER